MYRGEGEAQTYSTRTRLGASFRREPPPQSRVRSAMIECARPPDSSMYVPLPPADPAPLDRFQVFNKNWAASYTYDYYTTTYDPCIEAEIDNSTNVYHTLTSRNYALQQPRDEWRSKFVDEWTEDDTMSWFVDTLRSMELSEYDWAPSKFRIPGIALRGMSREEVVERMTNSGFDPAYTRRCGEKVFEKLSYLCGYVEHQYQRHEQPQALLGLEEFDNRERIYEFSHDQIPQTATDSSSNDAEEYNYRNSDTPSPECCYGSDGSKSGDELEDKRKVVFKRPPGRPKGSGRKVCKRPRSESVPEFLKNLILNPQYCPSIIKWEDYNRGMFRFVKPDDVAKLWGTQKQNESMTFEKFSRAMRYHYRNSVLVSVPTQRLVYQFGPKGPDYRTDNPNFVKVKSELDVHNDNLYS